MAGVSRLERGAGCSEKRSMPNRFLEQSRQHSREENSSNSIWRSFVARVLFLKTGKKKSIVDIVTEAQRVTLTATLLFAALAVVILDLAFSTRDLIFRATTGSYSVAQYASVAVAHDDLAEIQRLLDAEGTRGDREVLIQMLDGRIYSSLDGGHPSFSQAGCSTFLCFESVADEMSSVSVRAGGIVSSRVILASGVPVGHVYLRFSTIPIFRRAAIVILFFVFGGMMGFIWARKFSRRTATGVHESFRRFIQVTREISQKEDFSLRVRSQAGLDVSEIEIVELEDLASEFDRMIDRIEVRDQFLEVMNQDLEERVERRTQDLAAERAKSVESARLATLGEMASGIAHEINNPLAIIKASAEQLLSLKHEEDGEALSERAQASVERINKVTDRIGKIINSLRTFARDGRLDEFETVAVDRVVSDTLDFCLARFRSHGVRLDCENVRKGVLVNCRQVQVSQVLLNLLNNSFDALLASKVSHPMVSIECRETKQSVELVVADNGPGIPVDLRDKVLLPFFTTKEVGKGTGLGLSISRSIMADHGGELIVEAPHRGACIVMRFPKTIAGVRSPAA